MLLSPITPWIVDANPTGTVGVTVAVNAIRPDLIFTHDSRVARALSTSRAGPRAGTIRSSGVVLPGVSPNARSHAPTAATLFDDGANMVRNWSAPRKWRKELDPGVETAIADAASAFGWGSANATSIAMDRDPGRLVSTRAPTGRTCGCLNRGVRAAVEDAAATGAAPAAGAGTASATGTAAAIIRIVTANCAQTTPRMPRAGAPTDPDERSVGRERGRIMISAYP